MDVEYRNLRRHNALDTLLIAYQNDPCSGYIDIAKVFAKAKVPRAEAANAVMLKAQSLLDEPCYQQHMPLLIQMIEEGDADGLLHYLDAHAILIDAQLDIGADTRCTLLMYAYLKGQVAVVRSLIEAGVDVLKSDAKRVGALDYAKRCEFEEVIEPIKQLLFEAGVTEPELAPPF